MDYKVTRNVTVSILFLHSHWILFIITRIILYSLYSMQAIILLCSYFFKYERCDVDWFWGLMIFVWILYANYDHFETYSFEY